MSNKNDVFIDTFALNNILKENVEPFIEYFNINKLRFILSSLQIIELYNPHPEENDRIEKVVKFLSSINFIIVDPQKVFEFEEKKYPKVSSFLPVNASSEGIFCKINIEKKKELLRCLFRYGLPDYGVPLMDWIDNYQKTKETWMETAIGIIENARVNGVTNSKDEFLQYLNVRLCPHFVEIKECFDSNQGLSGIDRQWLVRLNHLLDNNDSYKMKGINLTSLIFWYDYIKANKAIQGSDIGDILYSVMFPYCRYVVVDNSRSDCFSKISKNEGNYRKLKTYNLKTFKKEEFSF